MISPDEPGYELLIDDIFSCMEIAQELSKVSIRDQKRIHELMGEILGKPLPESTTLLPPLYIDYGKP
ncbi:MAG: sugar O-acetyltransferase, partial [Paramuribaculum sp.]|nr:sugar O-acetyltransferase [Paramuribaculum sp.]